jgi:methionyl-tRNA formyltransferase
MAAIVFFGSGDFGLPTLKRLHAAGRVRMVVSQPDRPAGRGRRLTPTPISAFALEQGIPLVRAEDVNVAEETARIRGVEGAGFVVIAFGQKLKPAILADRFAINLHGSLLPRHRGAAPVQWSILSGDAEAGLSVITLAQKMDTGLVLGQWATEIGELETAGELQARLSAAGPELVDAVLTKHDEGTLAPQAQDESKATHARKLTRADSAIDFAQSSFMVQRKIHGLSPKPGCAVRLNETAVRILRARREGASAGAAPGEITTGGAITCGEGSVVPVDVQPAGGALMSWDAFRRGHRVAQGMRCEPATPVET